MGGYAIKTDKPYIMRKKPERRPASEEYKEMIRYMDSHTFSFRYDKDTGEFIRGVKEK